VPDGKIETVHVGSLPFLRPGPRKPFLVPSSGEPGKTLFLECQRDGDGAQPVSALFQDPADIIDGQILLAQGDDRVPDTIGFRRSLGPLLRGKEEGALWIPAELMGENAEASRGIPEATGDLGRRELIDEVGPEGFVLTMRSVDGFEKVACH
jgi:hypothetical protein